MTRLFLFYLCQEAHRTARGAFVRHRIRESGASRFGEVLPDDVLAQAVSGSRICGGLRTVSMFTVKNEMFHSEVKRQHKIKSFRITHALEIFKSKGPSGRLATADGGGLLHIEQQVNSGSIETVLEISQAARK